MLLAAKIWHFWIGFYLTIGALLAILALVVGYLVKVERPRYPRRKQVVELPFDATGQRK